MMGLSFGHLILLLVIILVVFGAGKLPRVMGDLAKGAKAFKDGLKDEDAKGAFPTKIAKKDNSDESEAA